LKAHVEEERTQARSTYAEKEVVELCVTLFYYWSLDQGEKLILRENKKGKTLTKILNTPNFSTPLSAENQI